MRQKRRSRDRKVIPNDPIVKLEVDNTKRPRNKVNQVTLARSRSKPVRENSFTIPSFPPGVAPVGKDGEAALAMDSQIIEINAWASQNVYNGAFNNGATFLGYPYLAELAQVPEYRKITETIAMHMTREFITLQSVGDGEENGGEDKSQKIKEITDDLENFKVRDVFRKAAEIDGYFGRAHLYIDLGYENVADLKFPIGNGRDALSRLKVKQGDLKGFKVIEPVWTYPSSYNSNNPFTDEWYNPQSWFVLGKEIHNSRCMRMVGHEVTDMLKPSYSFGGLSMSQMAKPYIDNWLRTRQSVADLIWSFSVSGVSTDLQTIMQEDGQALYDRAELFNNLRNNRGMMILNKESEEFFQVNTPLGTLDKLQAQAQEHMASVSSIPLVFLLGITPSGLNASSEGEIRAFYDFIHAYQMKFFTEPLTRVIDFIQLNRYGVVDPEITFIFEPLWSMDEKALAEIDKTQAETDDLRINGGVISPLEARKRVAVSPDTPYANLDVTQIPVPPGSQDMDGDGAIEPGEDPEIGGRGLDPGKPDIAGDEFNESKHPRGQPGNAGQFGSGGGGSTSGESNAPHHKEIKKILAGTAGISQSYRANIKSLLDTHGHTLNAETKIKLKHKMIESYVLKSNQLEKAGDHDKAKAVAMKAAKLASSMGTLAPKKPESEAEQAFQKIKDMPPIGQPTAAELTAAKKGTSVPNYENLKAVKDFNDKWSGDKAPKTDEAAKEKIADYKKMKEDSVVELNQKAESASAAQKEKSKKEAEALAKEMSDPEAAKHYEVLKSLGKNLPEWEVKSLNSTIKKAGLEGTINAVDCALIQAYTGSHYGSVNKQIRAGVLSKEQFGYAQALQKALLKLPKFEGIVKRGTQLPDEIFKKYKPGYIVPEHAFTSTGEGFKFSGTHTYEIQSIAGRDVRNISSQGPGEQEVIFPAGSHFEVVSVTGNHIKLKEVESI